MLKYSDYFSRRILFNSQIPLQEKLPIKSENEYIGADREQKIKEDMSKILSSFVNAFTKNNAKRAGVFNNIRVFKQNALDIKNEGIRGTVVCNPPYGERLLDIDEVTQLYRQMGKAFTNLAPWQIYILSSVRSLNFILKILLIFLWL